MKYNSRPDASERIHLRTGAGSSTMGVMSGGSLGCLIYMLLFVPTLKQSTEHLAKRRFSSYSHFCPINSHSKIV